MASKAFQKQAKKGRQRGAALVEMAIVILVFLMLVFGILEFARAIFEWSRLVEATRSGVRYAIVNDPACNIFDETWESGDPQYLKQDCTPGPLQCDGGNQTASMTIAGDCKITQGSNQKTDAACRIVAENRFEDGNLVEVRGNMRRLQPLINAPGTDVTITYTCTDAGFAGNAQRVPAVTVSVENVEFYFVASGLLGIDASVTMPSFETTRTGEDLEWIRTTK